MKPRITLNPDVMCQRIGERMVLLSLDSNVIFELNDTGARVWELLQAGAGEDEILDRLVDEFAAARGELRRDLDDLLTVLRSQGLIR